MASSYWRLHEDWGKISSGNAYNLNKQVYFYKKSVTTNAKTISALELDVEGYLTRLLLAIMKANIQEHVKKCENCQKSACINISTLADITQSNPLCIMRALYSQWLSINFGAK